MKSLLNRSLNSCYVFVTVTSIHFSGSVIVECEYIKNEILIIVKFKN